MIPLSVWEDWDSAQGLSHGDTPGSCGMSSAPVWPLTPKPGLSLPTIINRLAVIEQLITWSYLFRCCSSFTEM